MGGNQRSSVIKNARQFIIPIYQRSYQWGEDECLQLWNDIRRIGQSKTGQKYFIGSVVYIEDDVSTLSQKAPVLVIDGHQRLTSVRLRPVRHSTTTCRSGSVLAAKMTVINSDKVTTAAAAGGSYRWIARDLAISKHTVLEIMKRHRQSAL